MSSPVNPQQKVGVVGKAGAWSTERLMTALRHKGAVVEFIEMGKVTVDLQECRVMSGDLDLRSLDSIVVKKIDESYAPGNHDRLDLLRLLQHYSVRVFSDPGKLSGLINRLSCTVTLRNGGIDMPDTTVTESPAQAMTALSDYELAVAKPLYSTKARGMEVLTATDPCAREKLKTFADRHGIIYLQRLAKPLAQDLGIAFLNGRYIGAYARVAAAGSWNTTTRDGGKYAAADPDDAVIDLAKRAQDLFGLDFTCVDVIETADGPKVLEVSAFGGFRGLWEACRIDAADLIADHVLNA